MTRSARFFLVLLLAMIPAPASVPRERDACGKAMALLDSTVADFKSYRGRFSHTVVHVNEGATEIEEGTLSASRGGKLRWEYSKPSGKLFVSDGKTAWLYIPEDNRVYKSKISFKSRLPVLARIFLGELKPSREFFCVASDTDAGVTRLELGYKERNVSFRRLVVSIDEKSRFFSEISYLDEFGNRVVFAFSDGQVSPVLPPSLFDFVPPKGARVSEEPEELGGELGM